VPIVRLSDYLTAQKLPFADFGHRVGVTGESVRLWVHGKRVPRPDVMARIVDATGGAVQPGDFYPTSTVGDSTPLTGVVREHSSFSVEERLRLFDLASERQRRRQASAAVAPEVPERGWTREDLYRHGSAD